MALRYIALSVVFVVVTGLLGYWSYASSLNNARFEFEREERKLADVQRSCEQAKKRLEALNNDFAQADQRNRELHTKLTSMPGFIDTLESERIALENEWREVIFQGRARCVGLKFPSLRLKSGVTVNNVLIQRISGKELQLSHEAGALRLRMNELPEPLASRFRVDDPIFAGNDPMGTGVAKPEETVTPLQAPPAATSRVNSTTITDLVKKRDNLTSYLTSTTQARESWRQRATELRSKHMIARSSGRVSSYAAEATAAEGKAAELQTEINRVTAQLDQIQRELTDAALSR
jgi:peptidoglycan hydrolase CwlO-like protein